jgi:hypothetical protein
MNDKTTHETEQGRPLTDIEWAVLNRPEDQYRISNFLKKRGFESFDDLISGAYAKPGEDPYWQRNVYLGQLRPNPSSIVDFSRHLMSLSAWANANQLSLLIEPDGRLYLTSNFFHNKDPNTLPYGWMAMILDGFAEFLDDIK